MTKYFWEIRQARNFAKCQHGDKLDDEGLNYFDAHVEHTVQILRQITDNPLILVVGYLHDVLEDTPVTYEELFMKFGEQIADLVLELTHDGQKDEYGYYFPRLKSKEAILVKFADRLSNLSRMNAWNEERQAHYLKKSHFWKDGTDNIEDGYTIVKMKIPTQIANEIIAMQDAKIPVSIGYTCPQAQPEHTSKIVTED